MSNLHENKNKIFVVLHFKLICGCKMSLYFEVIG